MSSARQRRRGKQLDDLVRENSQLHHDVEDLETALFLHKRSRDHEDNSIQGLIRKEVGGSRWEHGGAGRLLSYKSNQDLEEHGVSTPGNHTPAKSTKAGSQDRPSVAGKASLTNGGNTAKAKAQTLGINGEHVKNVDSVKKTGKSNKIMDLKSKVLHKASLKIIKRDNWPSPSTLDGQDASATLEDRHEQNLTTQPKKKGEVVKPGVPNKKDKSPGGRSVSIQDTTYQLNHASANISQHEMTSHKTESAENLKKTLKKDNQGKLRNVKDAAKQSKGITVDSSNQRSRLDIYETIQNKSKHSQLENKTETNNKLLEENNQVNYHSAVSMAGLPHLDLPVECEANADVDLGHNSSLVNNGNVYSTTEATQIYIDPENFQVRVKSGANKTVTNYSGLEETKVLIQPSVATVRSSASEKIPCSVLDSDIVNTQNEVRDIFGLNSLDVNKNAKGSQLTPSTNPVMPSTTHTTFVLTKECDSEVEFWLRGLDLPDVEKYVKIFAENEIDLLDLEFMSASQLHEMGVTCLGALNTIVHGIKDLKNKPVPKVKRHQDPLTRHLQAHSIAWEDVDTETTEKRKKKSAADKKSVGSAKNKLDDQFHKGIPKKSETSMKVKKESTTDTKVSLEQECRRSLSPGSVTSSRPNSSRTNSSTGSKSVNAGRRPPNAKHPGNQSPNTNGNQSARSNTSGYQSARSNTSGNQSVPPLNKQPNSDRKKMSNLEAKPTKGVLLNRRSSSLTRDSRRNRKEGAQKLAGDNTTNKQTGTRSRSRSADPVNRKAMASVHAAARKFEDKQQRDRENVKYQTKWQERQKHARDEMAARHLQREKSRELKDLSIRETDDSSIPSPPAPVSPPPPDNLGWRDWRTLSLSTSSLHPPTKEITQMSGTKAHGPKKTQQSDGKSKARVTTPSSSPAKKSLRRVEPPKKTKYISKTVDLPSAMDNLDYPVLSTYKIGGADKPSSDPEIDNETNSDGSYIEIAGRVADIQLKIKRLKSQATNGDEMTLTLVGDLQDQLQLFEHQLSEKEHPKQTSLYDRQLQQQQWFVEKEREIKERHLLQSRSSQGPPKPTPRKKAKIGAGKSTPSTQNEATPIEFTPVVRPTPSPRKLSSSGGVQAKKKQSAFDEILAEDVSLRTGSEDEGPEVVGSRSDREGSGAMSKSELLDEMRKEKHDHHRQIRMLQTELKRLKHSDPASMMELDSKDIVHGPEDLLGEGEFSQVFRGQYQGTEVAVKRLRAPLHTQDRNYFSAEVSLLRELRHPRVVLLIGVCTVTKLPILVLEYMSHGSLYNHLHDPDQASLDHAEYYQLARDIALGMNYLHAHRPEVLHLDLKSMNILLCQGLRAKIGDFGFSKLRHEAGSTPTRRGKSRGPRTAPCWTAPELLDKGEVTSKADVYSFAIILWEMVTRKVPYEHCSVFQVLEMVRKFQRPKLPDTCPQGLSQLIGQCWEQNPAKRPQYKDIIPTLDHLAFPPAWRALFQEAGVSDEALHNVESTRKIISMVTHTLGSEDSKMLQSFILPHTDHKSQDKTTSKDEKEAGETSVDCESDIFKVTERSSHVESEFTLRNLEESSTESDASKSVSETDSDDDYLLLTSEMTSSIQSKVPQISLNVFVPSLNLEESIKTTREDFHSERGKIEKNSDWLCISLDDDRTYRETDDISKTSPLKGSTHSPKLLSKDRTVTPINLSSSVTDTSYQERKSPSSKAKEYNIKEFLRIESIDNRRPNSPKKRVSLTKKLADRTSKSFESSYSVPDSCCHTQENVYHDQFRDDMPTKNSLTASRKLSDTERSFDSFFGLSLNGKMEAKTLERQDSTKSCDAQAAATSCRGKHSGRDDVKLVDVEPKPSLPSSQTVDPPTEINLLANASTKTTVNQFEPLVVANNMVDSSPLHIDAEMNMPKVNIIKDVYGTKAEIPPTGIEMENEFKIDVLKLFHNTLEILADDSDSTPRNIPSIVTTPRNFDPSVQSTPRDIDSSTTTTPRNTALITPRDMETSASTTPRHSALTTPRDGDMSPTSTMSRNSVLVTPRNLEILEELSCSPDNDAPTFSQDTLINDRPHSKGNPSVDVSKTDLNQNLSRCQTHLLENNLETQLRNVPKKGSVMKNIPEDSEMNGLEYEFNEKSPEQNINYENTKDDTTVKLDMSENDDDKPIKTPRKSKRKDIDNDRSTTSLYDSLNNVYKGQETCYSAGGEICEIEYNSVKMEQIREAPFLGKMKAKSDCTNNSEHGKHLTEQLMTSKQNSEIKFPHKHDGGENRFTRVKLTEIAESENMNNNSIRVKLAPAPELNNVQSNNIKAQKKNKIRVKLRKDPLAPKLIKQPIAPRLSSGPPSPVPPAPPPPPAESLSRSRMSFSRSVQEPSPSMSITDELKLRLSTRQSYAEGMKMNRTIPKRGNSKRQIHAPSIPELRSYSKNSTNMLAPGPHRLVQKQEVGVGLVPEDEGGLIPEPSDGLPQFSLQSVELLEQRELLKSISKMHPDQLDDLSSVSQEQLISIGDILRKMSEGTKLHGMSRAPDKAVTNRRLAMGEDATSVSQSLDSVSWSVDTG